MTTPIFYDPRQSIKDVASFSKSAEKPSRFVDLAISSTIDVRIIPVDPITKEDLYLVHDKDYVDGVFDGHIVNGFGNSDPRVPESCLWTIGSLVTAALNAKLYPTPVCSPTSGFHHAGYDFGEGYCTFNGLMLAAIKYIQSAPGARVAILDMDMHYGNGTDSILDRLPHLKGRITNYSSGKNLHTDAEPAELFEWLRATIRNINRSNPDLVIYQAGADMHIEDPLGGILDSPEMRARDRMVFNQIQAPVVWNLAGGYRNSDDAYQDPTLQCHLATLYSAEHSIKFRQFKPTAKLVLEARESFHEFLLTQGFGRQETTTRGEYPSQLVTNMWLAYESAYFHKNREVL